MRPVYLDIDRLEKHPGKVALALFLFHLSVSAMMYAVACSPYLASMHNAHGLWNFSPDSFGYHQEALRLLTLLQAGHLSAWWDSSAWPHVKWIALSYFLFGPYPISFAPVNAGTWVLTVFAAYGVAKLLIPDNRSLAALGAMIFSLMPTYLLQTTQLLKDPLYILGVCALLLFMTQLLKGDFSWKLMCLAIAGGSVSIILRHYMYLPLAAIISFFFVIAFFRVPETRKRVVVAAGVFFVWLCACFFWGNGGGALTSRVVSVAANASSAVKTANAPSAVKTANAPSLLVKYADRLTAVFQYMRHSYTAGYHAGSTVDPNIVLKNWMDGVRYLPRALQVGMFSPFPSDWLQRGYTTGRGARLLAGAEMLLLYVLMAGFVVFIVFCESVPLRLRLGVLIFSSSFLLLLGLAVPNMGSLYRMRYAYLLPIMLGGISGWHIMLNRSSLSFFNRVRER